MMWKNFSIISILILLIALVLPVGALTYTSHYPVGQNSTYVKSTVEDGSNLYHPYYATDPAKSLTGTAESNSWQFDSQFDQSRFHIDLGSGYVIKRIYYENFMSSGGQTDRGVKNFTVWGSNSGTSFSTLTYGTDTGWTQITADVTQMAQHPANNNADPHYTLLTNTNSYRYYCIKTAPYTDANFNWGSATRTGFRRVELQTEDVIAPVASFTKDKTSGTSPLTVTFTDTSTNTPTSWFWVFGDGDTTNNTQQNPVHTFTGAGIYNVNLTATNAGGSNTTATQSVTVGIPPDASFNADVNSGAAPLTVHFTDTSTNTPTSWFWVFGDGDSTNSTVESPYHTFTSAGNYFVNLTATNAYGSNTTGLFEVTVGLPPAVSFTRSPTYPITYEFFTDTSTGSPTSWLWQFRKVSSGAQSTNTSQNAAFLCALYGDYTANLTATNAFGSNKSADITFTCGNIPSVNWQWFPTPPRIVGTQVYFQEYNTAFPPYTDGWDIQAPNGTYFYNFSTTNPSANITLDAVGTWKVREDTCNNYGCTASTWYDYLVFNIMTPQLSTDVGGIYDIVVPKGYDVQFSTSDQSGSKATNWYYVISDGQSLNTATYVAPIFSMDTVGNFTANVTTQNSTYGISGTSPKINITVYDKPTTALWTPNVTSGTGNYPPVVSVLFVSSYTVTGYDPGVNYKWYINGAEVATGQNMTVNFNDDGHFLVNLSVYNAAGSAWYNSTYDVVGAAPVIDSVSANPISGSNMHPVNVSFMATFNLTLGHVPLTYLWNFGDATTSTNATPYHVFTAPGTFNVSLTATNAGGSNTAYMNYVVLPIPVQAVAQMKWVDANGYTITTANTGTNDADPTHAYPILVFDTVGTGINPPLTYVGDYFELRFFRQDDNTHMWILTQELYSARETGTQPYHGLDSSIDVMPTAGLSFAHPPGTYAWNGYMNNMPLSIGKYRAEIQLRNLTDETLYPPIIVAQSDITIQNNPTKLSNIGDWAGDVGGLALQLVLAAVVVIICMVIPYLWTRQFNIYLEMIMAVVGIGLAYFIGFINIWIIAGLVILAVVVVFFMNRGGGNEPSEGGEMG